MIHPIPLYDCKYKNDAYFLKNIIQRITCISVEIVKDHNQLILIVDDGNYYKAKTILDNQLDILPSTIIKKTASTTVQSTELKNKEILEKVSFGGFSLQTLFMNFSFSG